MPRRGLLLLLLASGPALAQEGPDVAPEAPAMPAAPLAERFVWERRAGFGHRVAGVAVQPVAAGAWIAVDEKGGVWLSEDEGGRWDNVVRPVGALADDELPDDEELLLEAETRREEALEEAPVEPLDRLPDLDEPVPEGEDVELPEAPEADEAVLGEAGAEAADLVEEGIRGVGGLGFRYPPVVWVDPTDPEKVFVARADGTWRSTSAGRTWEHVRTAEEGDPHVTSFFRGADGALVLGTSDGVRYSTDDGASWIDVEDATDGARVYEVTTGAGALWAATEQGLFKSSDGLAWARIQLPTNEPVRSVVADPSWESGFWVATPTTLYRTDDGGANFYVAGRQPLRGLRRLVHLDEPGHLLAVSDDGVWESMDGGVAWSTADRRLSEPDVRSLAFADNGPVIATPNGVWRMVTPREVSKPTRDRPALSLSETIGAATHRDGMEIDLLSLAELGIAARIAPQLELRFDWGASAGRDADYVSASTVDAYDNDWALGARLCWGACSTTVTVAPTGEYEYETDRSFYVFDGQVFDEGEPVAAAANVAQSIRSYRRYLAEHVADAWLARSRLVAETNAVRALPLRDQVLHAVQIQELEARLDALTDGAFSRSSRASPPPEESP